MGGVWLAWLAGWINRVELRTRAEPTSAALGLEFEAEGVLARVVARGTVQEVPVRVRWRVGWFGSAVDVAVRGGRWEQAPEGVDVVGWVRERAGALAVSP